MDLIADIGATNSRCALLDERGLITRSKRYLNRDWSTVAGYRFTNEHGTRDRVFAGVQHRLPFLTYGTVTLDSEGDVRPGLSRELQLTSRLSWINELEYDSRTEWEWNLSLIHI